MSLQQVLEVARVQHLFWENELERAPRRDRDDCEFFRRQVKGEVAVLNAELAAAGAYRPAARAPDAQPEERLSSERPPTRMMRGLP
jgi:hypothetical protein